MAYNSEHVRLLKKAKLLGKGFVYIKSIADDRKLFSRSASNVLEQTDRPRVDYTQLRSNSTQPVMLPGGNVAGSWTKGLTKTEIETIKSLGVPEVTEVTTIPYYDGMIFDLSDPAQVAMFNVLLQTNAVAPSEDELGSRRFYFVKSLDKRKNVDRKKETLREALNIENKISIKYKRRLFEIINHMYDEQYTTDEMSDDEISDVFGEWVLEDDKARTIVEKSNNNENMIRTESALCRGFNKGIFAFDTEGKVTRSVQGSQPVVYAESYDEALMFLLKDQAEVGRINLLTAETNVIMKSNEVTPAQFDDMYITDDYDFENVDFFSLSEYDREALIGYAEFVDKSKDLSTIEDDDELLKTAQIMYLRRFTKAEMLEMFKEYMYKSEDKVNVPHINTSHKNMSLALYDLLSSIDVQLEEA